MKSISIDNRRIMVRASDVHRLVDLLANEAIEEAGEHAHALDGLRQENAQLRAHLAEVISECAALRAILDSPTNGTEVVDNAGKA